MRLVSFNILEGLRPLERSATERRLVDRDRMNAAQTVVADLAPDILVLNEALFCREFANKVVDYRSIFGMRFQAAALYEEAWGNTILSRFPIGSTQEMRIYNRGGLIAGIDTPEGHLTVASYHPHPARYPENKAVDFARLVAGIAGPAIICGDLNCINPEDCVERASLVKAFESFTENADAVVDRFIESGKRVFAALAEFGFSDAVPLEGRLYSMPTDLINLDKSSAMRIDHVLTNHRIEVLSGRVVHSLASNRASDHHPVSIEFRIDSCGF